MVTVTHSQPCIRTTSFTTIPSGLRLKRKWLINTSHRPLITHSFRRSSRYNMRSLLLSFELYSDPPTKTIALLPCLGQGQSQGKFLAGTVVKAIRQAQLKRNDAIILEI